MAISFNQVANPSFSDSNKLLEVALAQSAKATEGLQGTLNTAVGNVEDANLAKIRQLVDSQSREQLQDPVHQQLMQKQITDMTAATGGTYDPLKVADYQDKRITSLMGREITQSNLDNAKLSQAGIAETNDFNKKNNQYVLDTARRNNLNESEATLASNIAGTMDFYYERMKAAGGDAELQKQLEAQRDADIAGFGYIPTHVYNSAMEINEAADAQKLKDKNGNLLTESRLQTEGVNRVVALTGADNQTKTVQINAAKLALQGTTATNKERAAVVKENKDILTSYNYSPKVAKADGTINPDALIAETRTKANKAMAAVDKAEGTFEDYVTNVKSNPLSNDQMQGMMKALENKNLTDYQKIAFFKQYQMNPGKAETFLSTSSILGVGYTSLFEKELKPFLASGVANDIELRQGEAAKKEYQDMVSALVQLGYDADTIVKDFKIDSTFKDYEYLPIEIIEASGGSLAAIRANKKGMKGASNALTNFGSKGTTGKSNGTSGRDVRLRQLTGNGVMN